MSKNTTNPDARSRLFQLLALGFTHPVEEFYQLLVGGTYSHTLARLAGESLGCDAPVRAEQPGFADFEADYIHLFQMGRGGKPLVALTAGDHSEISQDQNRPEFMLQYSGWYKHFGLKISESEDANELPDHLACQLEFIAWLSHLESDAADDQQLRAGYQRAQRDFLQRHLQPFLEVLVSALQKQTGRPHVNPFYLDLTTLALEASYHLLEQLDSAIGEPESINSDGATELVTAVNLWG